MIICISTGFTFIKFFIVLMLSFSSGHFLLLISGSVMVTYFTDLLVDKGYIAEPLQLCQPWLVALVLSFAIVTLIEYFVQFDKIY